jgi:hypothetical protein
MGKWRESKRALERLSAWQRTKPAGDGALSALADVGLLRRVLDQAEMAAVRVARRNGKSWTEIATTMGITRQSAWERWRDLDEPTAQREAAPQLEPAPPPPRAMPAEVLERATSRLLSGRALIVVPMVVGMSWEQARQALVAKGLTAVGHDPDAPPPLPHDWSRLVVTDQSPESGAKVPTGSAVRLWTERGGGSGVREPLRPAPTPRQARGMRDEVSGEAIG